MKRSSKVGVMHRGAEVVSVKVGIGDQSWEIGTAIRPGPRQCGSCTLCCKLVPVESLDKPAGKPCKFQRFGKGCIVHHTEAAGFPPECGLWNCQWLSGNGTEGMPRPDRAHYVIDPLPDFIWSTNRETGERYQMACVQIWVDPQHPEAWREPRCLAYIERMAATTQSPTLIRYDNRNGFPLFAPCISSDGEWHEVRDSKVTAESDPIERFLAAGIISKAAAEATRAEIDIRKAAAKGEP